MSIFSSKTKTATWRRWVHDQITSSGTTVTAGSWTPVLSDGTNDATMTNQAGRYIKVGDNMVYITCHITVNSLASASGAARITGLPFIASSISAGFDYPLAVGEATSLATAADKMVSAQVEANTSYITLHLWDGAGAGTTAMTVAEVSNTGTLKLNGLYITP